MTINTKQEGPKMTIALEGRLDTLTAPDLEAVIKEQLHGVNDLVFDMKEIDYVSSAGLRVLLAAQKIMNGKGTMVVKGASEIIMEIFEVTGFIDLLNIEQ